MKSEYEAAGYNMLGLKLKSSVIVGSGLISDQAKNIRQLLMCGAGAVVTKTIYPLSVKTHTERVYPIGTGLLNNTHYSKRTVDNWLDLLGQFHQQQLPIIASVHAPSPGETGLLVAAIRHISDCPLELGISCLHADDFTEDNPERVYAYADAVRQQTDAKFSVKLSLGQYLHERVQAACEGGASAITLSDTIPGIAFDLVEGKAVLGGVCGYSGPGIKPLVLAAICELRQRGVSVPIMGSGGVQSGLDVHEYMLAGAETVQVYSALHQGMFTTLERILEQYQSFCARAQLTEVSQ
uniref:Dihydroorotate dehydrogenase catalytic domain-containing protein n=1 Tax=Erwinia amylovora ATCC BAA-2158 TaxID=889211 RepID=E5B1A8_ERWAM|nr:hypothetical protein, similar to dihydroorotate oxidase [Erwinia amylovora ATCC BAA-2158]